MDDCQLSQCDSIPTGRDEDESIEISTGEGKYYWTVPLHSKSTTRSGKTKAKEATVQSGRSVKGGGCLRSIKDLEILSLLASFWATSIAMISWQFSVSYAVGILFLMPSVGVEGALTSLPVSTFVVVGKPARINCSTGMNQPVYWARTLAGSNDEQWLFNGIEGFNANNTDGRFSIDKNEVTGRYDLNIEDVQQKDAGQYACIDESGIGAKASAELTVSAPINCKSRNPSAGVMGYNDFGIPQDFIQFSCSLNYTGNLTPTLEWSWPGSVVQSVEQRCAGATSSVTSTLKLSATKELNKVQFQCKANIEGLTQYAFDSGLLWKSETVNVRYAVFTSNQMDVCPVAEMNLDCNPRCSYAAVNDNHKCTCHYTYHDPITLQKYEVTSDPISCGKQIDVGQVVLITAASVIALLATVIFVTVCFLIRKRKKRYANYERANGGRFTATAVCKGVNRI